MDRTEQPGEQKRDRGGERERRKESESVRALHCKGSLKSLISFVIDSLFFCTILFIIAIFPHFVSVFFYVPPKSLKRIEKFYFLLVVVTLHYIV